MGKNCPFEITIEFEGKEVSYYIVSAKGGLFDTRRSFTRSGGMLLKDDGSIDSVYSGWLSRSRLPATGPCSIRVLRA